MNETEIRQSAAVQNALLKTFHSVGMKPLQDTEGTLLEKLTAMGVTADTSAGYLSLTLADGTEVVPSAACERLRKENPLLFVADPKRDAVSSREDLERGTPEEIFKAKSAYIKTAGADAYERLPRTKAEAEVKAAAPSPSMTRKEYLSLNRHDKAQLAGVIGAAGIGKIMARR